MSESAERVEEVAKRADEVVPLGRRELFLIFAFWTVFALLTAANRLLDPRTSTPTFSLPPVALAFLESYLWAILTPPLFWLSSRFSVGRGSRLTRALLLLAAGIVVALFVDLVVELVRESYFPLPRRRQEGVFSIWTITRFRFLNDLMVYFAVIAAGLARDYFLRFRARQEETVRLQAHAAQLQAQLAEARLDVLRTQLNPHFLFNTLHAVSALVERDPAGVRRMVARLSELLRYTLDGTTSQEIELRDEIELLRRYLDIMQIRFQGRLETRIDVAPDVENALVPNLILQPLVENALKHGVERTDGAGRVEIRARRAGADVVLTVQNSGTAALRQGADGAAPPLDASASAPPSPGIGLRNTRARLEQLYGPQQRFTLQPAEDGGMVSEVVLPYHTRADLRVAGESSAPGAMRR